MNKRPPMADYYTLLGISREATVDEIKKAYRREARLAHPDHAVEYDPERFHTLKEAVDTLLDPTLRRRHDARLIMSPPPPSVKHDLSFVTRFVKKGTRRGMGRALATLFGKNRCPDCDGKGHTQQGRGKETLCPRCGGSGRVRS